MHRAKGRERDRVWLLDWSFYDRGQSEEGDNIYYVAATRSKKDLFLVGQPTRGEGIRVGHDGSLAINDDAGRIQEYDYTA